jgi:hypothetical protein
MREKKLKKANLAIAVFAIIIIAAVLVWQAPAIISMLNSSSPNNPFSGYTKITLVVSQPNSVQFGNNVYGFGYGGPETALYTYGYATTYPFSVVPQGIIGLKTFNAVQGATYNDLGLQILVGEVHNDYLILWVKSTVP